MHAEHIRELIAASLKRRPERIAVDCEGLTITGGELLRKAGAVAASLRAHGVEPRARVGLLLLDGIPFVESLHGAWLNGNVAVPLNYTLFRNELSYCIRSDQLAALIVSEPLLSRARSAIAPLDQPPTLFVVGAVGDDPGHVRYTRLLEGASAGPPSLPDACDDLLALDASCERRIARRALLSNANLLAQLALARSALDLGEGDRVLCPITLSHAVTLSVLNACIAGGATVVLQRKFDATRTLRSLEHEGITTLVGSAPMFRILADARGSLRALPALRRCISIAGSVGPELSERWQRSTGSPLQAAYTRVEAGGFVCVSDERQCHRGSLGRPCPPVGARIVDPDFGRVLAANTIGAIELSGAAVAAGYWRSPEETHALFRDGWFATGDLGWLDDLGELFLVEDRMLVTSDGRVVPFDRVPTLALENEIFLMREVADAAVCVAPDSRTGGRIHAVLQLRPGESLEAETIEAKLRERFDPAFVPAEYAFVAALPRTAAGRIDRRALLRATEARPLPPG